MNDNDQLLASLNVVSKVEKGGRICVHNSFVTLEQQPNGGFMQNISSIVNVSLRRYITHNNRQITILVLENLLLRCELATIFVTDIVQLGNACKDAIIGIENMKHTYCDDSYTVAKLDTLIMRYKNYTKKALNEET